MFYRTQIKSTGAGYATDINGKHLTFIGNLPCQSGDYVWTDGKVIFGNTSPKPQPVLFEEDGGIPVFSDNLRGYFDSSGNFKKYNIAYDEDSTPFTYSEYDEDGIHTENGYLDSAIIVNDKRNYRHALGRNLGSGTLVDTECSSDGKLLTAKKITVDYQTSGSDDLEYIFEKHADKIIISIDGTEAKVIDSQDYVKKPEGIKGFRIRIEEFKLFQNLEWEMLMTAQIEGSTKIEGAAPPMDPGQGVLTYFATSASGYERWIRVNDTTGVGYTQVLNDIQGIMKEFWGDAPATETLKTAPYLNFMAGVYGEFAEIRLIHIVNSSSNIYPITYTPAQMAALSGGGSERYWSKSSLIKVKNGKAEVLSRQSYLPEHNTTTVTNQDCAEEADGAPEGASADRTGVAVGKTTGIEYFGLLGNKIGGDIVSDINMVYPYANVGSFSASEGEPPAGESVDDWNTVVIENFLFSVQDDFSVELGVTSDTNFYGTSSITDFNLDIKALYKSGTKICDLTNARYFSINGLSATQINASDYLIGQYGITTRHPDYSVLTTEGGIFKISNGKIQKVDTGLKNFRLRKINRLSKTRR